MQGIVSAGLALTLALGLQPLAAHARVTQLCNSNYGTGEISIQGPENVRTELLAIVHDLSRNPDVYRRLWEPLKATLLDYRASEDEVFLTYQWIQDTSEIGQAILADPVLRQFGIRGAWRNSTAACFLPPPAPRVTVTEHHNRFLDHYFMSSSGAENEIIDRGGAGEGWERTGETFVATAAAYCYDTLPVFRFYARAANSHFFTVDAAECGGLRNHDPGWQFEGVAFGARAPQNGVCPGGTQPLYRLYNNRSAQGDPNHRYVARPELYEEMRRRGWIGEGITLCIRAGNS